VNPEAGLNHFAVYIPLATERPVQIYERFTWSEEGEQQPEPTELLKLEISKHKWSKVSAAITQEFNARLKKDKIKSGKFKNGSTPVEKLLGKEMMVLLWGIEDTDPTLIPIAIRNWLGLMPEERWWLYTMTNASTGRLHDRRGWRIALRFALCENPVEQISMDRWFQSE
jgi:hypothetical protein